MFRGGAQRSCAICGVSHSFRIWDELGGADEEKADVIPGAMKVENVSDSPFPGEGRTGSVSPCRHVGCSSLSPRRESEISVVTEIEASVRGIGPGIGPCLGAPRDPAGGNQGAPK